MYLGIEIGGTKLQLGLGPGDGTLAGLWRGNVDCKEGADGIRGQIMAAIPEVLGRSNVFWDQVKGVGIGFGGPVDDATQTVLKSHQIQGWDNFNLTEWLEESLELPVALGNDADVAGLAEALFGAGKGLSPIFYITIGSGIGGALIINGEIYRGCGRGAAEIGHLVIGTEEWLPVRLSDPFGGVLRSGWKAAPLEELASGWAVEKRAREVFNWADRDSPLFRLVLGQRERITAIRVAQAAAEGDPLANGVLAQALSFLAEAICHVIALLCPRRIIIGGGVALMGETLLFEPLRKLVAERVFKPFADCYDIVPAALGEEVVVHGALALAKKRFG